jgi:hypothetical protein
MHRLLAAVMEEHWMALDVQRSATDRAIAQAAQKAAILETRIDMLEEHVQTLRALVQARDQQIALLRTRLTASSGPSAQSACGSARPSPSALGGPDGLWEDPIVSSPEVEVAARRNPLAPSPVPWAPVEDGGGDLWDRPSQPRDASKR